MKQYLDLCRRIRDEGTWIKNDRTGIYTKVVIGAELVFDVEHARYPLVTTRKAPVKLAIGELLGYLKGLSDASEFAALGAPSWYANANENKSWLANSNRKGQNDMGRVYGVQLRDFKRPDGTSFDQLKKVYKNLLAGIDDRGEILMMYNPGEIELGCLRPCVYEHIFSLVGDDLYLHSTQRSCDVPLGLVANMQQCYLLLALMAQITGKNPKTATLSIINAHIYANQYDLMLGQLERAPNPSPRLEISPKIKTLDDIDSWVTPDCFKVIGYSHHPAIKYPFAV